MIQNSENNKSKKTFLIYLTFFFVFFLTGFIFKYKIIFFIDDYFVFNSLDKPSNRISRLILNFKIDYQKKKLEENLIVTENGNFIIDYFPLPNDIGEIRPVGYISLFNNNLIYASGTGSFFKYKIIYLI